MTYSVVAVDPENDLMGVAVATSPMAIGARCPRIRAGIGAAASQGITDAKLGADALELIAAGLEPAAAIEELRRQPHIAFRQLGLVDRAGNAAAHTGDRLDPFNGHATGFGFSIQGNHLASANVLPAMLESWRRTAKDFFERRLLAALVAGRDAGGDRSGAHSAALVVAQGNAMPRTDLRVDWAGDPGCDAVDALEKLVAQWLPLIPFYARRAQDPTIGDWQTWLRAQAASPQN